MLQHLHISNYALIQRIDIEFRPGLNIITGETGAGKSIILGALSLLLGGRADLKAIRDASTKSVIEATFALAGFDGLKTIFDDNDIDWCEHECILRRELSPNGRSRAFVNDTPVTLNELHDIAIRLVDIHSQHQNLLLSDPDYQLKLIDSLAGNAQLLQQYREAHLQYRHALKLYTDTRELINRSQANAEFMQYQFEQLREMNLVPGEQEDLERERDVLANMTQIKECLSGALDVLLRNDSNTLSQLASAGADIERLSDVLDEASSLTQRLESARLEIQDIAETLQDYDSELAADPNQLQAIEDRLSRIYSLESKHNVDSSDELIRLRDDLGDKLSTLSNGDDKLQQLEHEAKLAKKTATLIARQLSESRTAQAAVLAEELRNCAMPLGMPNLRCEIHISQGRLTPSGFDAVDFLFAFNKNQPLMSVGTTASGGEISRLILSIKSVVAHKMQLPTIIFDEVDTGVSGDIAVRMAALMAEISQTSQVIAITHLPQVASKGTTHYKVYKEDDETSTNTRIRQLSPDERVSEIALMLSGNASDPSAIAAARTMLS